MPTQVPRLARIPAHVPSSWERSNMVLVVESYAEAARL